MHPEDYIEYLAEAARSHCYVENTGNKADSMHRRIKDSYPEDMVVAYQQVIAKQIRNGNVRGPIVLAIDPTAEEFYGKHSDLFLRGWTGERGVQATYDFAVLSLVGKNKIPLMAIPWDLSMSHADMVRAFLAFARKLFPRIHCILLDAGFYAGGVVEALGSTGYIIRAPKKENIKKMIDATEYWEAWDHVLGWDGNRTHNLTKTKIVVVKDVQFKNGKGNCAFATNMQLPDGISYVRLYIKRWQIETNFRMQDQVHIKSKSLHIEIRFFYFLISLLLHAIWLLFHAGKMAFDAFKILLANYFVLLSVGIVASPFA